MKCKKSAGECVLEIKIFENGDVLECCTICDFKHLHEFKNIKNNHLGLHKKEN